MPRYGGAGWLSEAGPPHDDLSRLHSAAESGSPTKSSASESKESSSLSLSTSLSKLNSAEELASPTISSSSESKEPALSSTSKYLYSLKVQQALWFFYDINNLRPQYDCYT